MSDLATIPLGNLASLRRGITYTESALRDNPEDGIPYVNMKSFLKNGGFNSNGLKYYSGFFTDQDLVGESDILIANTDVTREGDIIGVPALFLENVNSDKILYSHHVTRLRLDVVQSVRYLFYLFCTDRYRREMKKYARGTTVLMLDMKGLQRIPVTYHVNIAQQDKIARILQTIDQAIEKTEALIGKSQQIKAGLMHDLFTRGIGPEGKLRPPREQAPELYKESPIGWIPKEWVFDTCEDVCEKVIDCKNRTPPITPDGHPVIRTPNVRYGQFVDDGLVYTDTRSYSVWTARGAPQPGDIVITREAPVGEVCKIPERHQYACLGQRMMLYRVDREKISDDFFLYVLQSRAVQARLDLISGGSTVGHVRVGDIRTLWIFYPESRDEQLQIAQALNHICSKLDTEASFLEALQKQKTGLMHDLLTGKVPVQVESEAKPEAVNA